MMNISTGRRRGIVCLPPVRATILIDFDSVMPADLGIQFVCQTTTQPTVKYPCDGTFAARNGNASWMWLGITEAFDANENPLIRITSLDYTWTGVQPSCTSDHLVYNRPASVSWTSGQNIP